ncbi:response regulator [Azospirillum sp. YIM DDC1]|uniref:Response regulator n=1 Tax=Azospirillum aestuarii TaxID=2802052 RepID=A0ABS1I8S8_9PROT|nr:response regulator [Azospirillum brasilense]MBK4723092.1 response regulator [Azospirillum aestuarii]TWA85874.1 response regulator receiver domain-containing protein [Azospirillum brasilense]
MNHTILHRQPQDDSHAEAAPPAAPASSAVTPSPAEDQLIAWATARGGRLLVVDDSPTNRLLTAALMRKAGFTVDTADGGAEAITTVTMAETPYDAVLMDVAMPEVDGIAATLAIRAMTGPRAAVPIIAVTAHGFAEDRDRCVFAGMNDYVPKPVRRPELLAALKRWLEPGGSDGGTVRRTIPVP